MPLKEKFSPDEWSNVILAPHLLATAVMMATYSGLGGTAKEAFSLGQSLVQGLAGSDALIKEVAAREELSAAQTVLRARTANLPAGDFKGQLNTIAIETARQAVETVARIAPEELNPYKQWLMDTAYAVANASKEGDFFGIGGQRISDGERAVLEQIFNALGLEARKTNP